MGKVDEIDVMILGAGVAGLGAALRAQETNREAIIFESNNSAGGLLDNFEINGFRFDNAVHLSFAKESKVREIFDQTSFYTHPADSLNFEKERWLKHPVQNNLYPLPPDEKVELINSFMARPSLTPEDYEGWLRHQYGDKIAERYPIKYTKKYWDTPASKLSTTWIGNRMRRAEFNEILFGAFTSDTPNTYYTKEMRYPKKGGYKSFIDPLIESSDIRYGHKAVSIDLDKRIVTFSNGTRTKYSSLISSVPLPLVVGMLKSAPLHIAEAAAQLVATSIDLVSVGFNKDIIEDLWFYIYDEDVLASRAYSPSIKSPDNVPKGCSSLQFEIYTRGTESRFEKKQLIDNVIYALRKMGIATEDDIVLTHHKHLKYGNVIFDHGMESHRDLIRRYLSDNGMETIGRFGEWDYLWSNQSFLSGYNSGDQDA